MAQHFLLSAAARTLSLKAIYQGGEDRAYETFRKLRWSETDGEPVCPKCGCLDAYEITRAASSSAPLAAQQFSVTSRHDLRQPQDGLHRSARRDLHFRQRRQGHVGAPALPRSGRASTRRPSCWRTSCARPWRLKPTAEMLDGEVEIDGAYFGGHVRPENRIEDREDRRLKAEPVRPPPRRGRPSRARRPHPAVRPSAAKPKASRSPALASLPTPSCSPTKPPLGCAGRRVRDAAASTTRKPTATATASTRIGSKAILSRLRRMVGGQHHLVSHQLPVPVREPCRMAGGSPSPVKRLECLRHPWWCAQHPVSRVWKGYWQVQRHIIARIDGL